MKDDVKEFIAVLALFIIVVGLLFGMVACYNKSGEEKFREDTACYRTITVNGEDYSTEDIRGVTYHSGIYEEDTIEMELADGTVVRFSAMGYTLKDKK